MKEYAVIIQFKIGKSLIFKTDERRKNNVWKIGNIVSMQRKIKSHINHIIGGGMLAAGTFELGRTYQDKISGYQGMAIGYVQYISGCNQILLQPKIKKDGAMIESCWFDEQRLKLIPGKPIILDNENNPGFDKPAPRR